MIDVLRALAVLVAAGLLFYGAACMIWPFWIFTKRWHGLAAFLAAPIIVFSVVPQAPVAKVEVAAKPSVDAPVKAAADDLGKQEAWIAATENAVRRKMKDPDSVRFRNVGFYRFEGAPMVCGEVNAKNSLGGYSGFQPFMASGDAVGPIMPDMMPDGEFSKSWRTICRK